jgi:hypothetical protein
MSIKNNELRINPSKNAKNLKLSQRSKDSKQEQPTVDFELSDQELDDVSGGVSWITNHNSFPRGVACEPMNR